MSQGEQKEKESKDASGDEDFWEDEEYYDTDEEAMPEGPEAEFYDRDLDDKDEAWVARQRGGRRSDAILSCPGCLTTVCIDCQQHAEKEGQFRAMFCINVRHGP